MNKDCPLCNGKKDIDDLDDLDYFELCVFHWWLLMEQSEGIA